PHVDDARRLIIFRSFGKFFGLAGVRLGFVLGPRAVIAQYRQRLGSWPLAAAALAIGTAAYRDTDWIAMMRIALRGQAAALDAVLARRG
ncbi:aminotransferase class I/II-fold pyridoxal phosphate-dependent enzyme, partial [Salmonella enterica]|uniref:aminotransferase class I/II-fold pyridoxal phosphate-dependent enzyme n=1 Tax=Salmonella enterica TaxID=28901 RepID=UPI003D2859DE